MWKLPTIGGLINLCVFILYVVLGWKKGKNLSYHFVIELKV